MHFLKFKQKTALFIFLVLSTAPVYAYIDPGSGSLLFQLLIATVIGLYFKFKNYLRELIIWIKTWFQR